MFARALPMAGLALMLFNANAGAAEATDAARETAVSACTTINQYGPVETVSSVEDGFGDWVVWVKDKDGDLWLCNANSSGSVFTNVMMEGDLLSGDGSALISYQSVADRSGGDDPASAANTLCAAIGSHVEDMEIVTTVEDGLGDYLVWLKNGEDELWLCNASGDGKLYDFEPIGMPINDVGPADLRYA